MSRSDKLFKEITEEEKPQIDNIQMLTKKIHHDLIDIQKKILQYARKPCNMEFDWIEQSGNIYFDDTGYKVRITENFNADADAKIGNFIECLSRHDFGMKPFFDNINIRLSHINESSGRCLDACVNHEWEKSDVELKGCMKKCITNNYNEFNNIFTEIQKKIAEVSPKL